MMLRLAKHVLLLAVYGVLGALLALLAVYVVLLQQRPDLQLWHEADLDAEFSAAQAAAVNSLDAYLQIEASVFEQLDAQIYARVPPEKRRRFLRFSAGSLADARGRSPDWNRTVERLHPQLRGAALLLHGLSDSPYSMHAMADLLYDQGLSVLALRLPGHGTAPSGLLRVQAEDWMAAVRLAMRHLAGEVGEDQPLYLVGYSTGAALAVEYAASRLLGEDLPAPSGMILLSPAIGVSPLAALAVWQSRLAGIPGLEKLAWTDILPEYDPYKYNSFTVNAGAQVYRVTQRIATELDALSAPGGITGMPPILAFQSVADATVSAPAVLNALFMRLAPEGHELVGFDINRHTEVEPLLNPSVVEVRSRLLDGPAFPVDFTLVVNASRGTDALVALRRSAGATQTVEERLHLAWPSDIHSLSHVALPFTPEDPIYGANRPPGSDLVFLGRVDLRGERGVLAVPGDALTRLRYNPFFAYVARRVADFVARR